MIQREEGSHKKKDKGPVQLSKVGKSTPCEIAPSFFMKWCDDVGKSGIFNEVGSCMKECPSIDQFQWMWIDYCGSF